MKFATHIHVPLRMSCNNFGDPLTFHLLPSSGQSFQILWFMNKYWQNDILMSLSCTL